ncbi:MAG: hypothetical protein ACI9YL_000611 [Luteibaculaceae bacterium]|jgi:hypothetical protein
MASRIYFVFILSFLSVSQVTGVMVKDSTIIEKQLKIAIRHIGHQILLLNQDSSSVVLPINKTGDVYTLSVSADIGFAPDTLVNIIQERFAAMSFVSSYIVEVLRCDSREQVYSFAVDKRNRQDASCSGRIQVPSCFQFVFHFNALSDQIIPFRAGSDSKMKKDGFSNFDFLAYGGGAFFIFAGLLFWQQKRKVGLNTIPGEFHQIGTMQFDAVNMLLMHGDEKVDLSGLETRLLKFLWINKNRPVEKEELLKEVWGNDGDYVGRTLDVNISKLRKKLEADPSIQIANVRGIGYKLIQR